MLQKVTKRSVWLQVKIETAVSVNQVVPFSSFHSFFDKEIYLLRRKTPQQHQKRRNGHKQLTSISQAGYIFRNKYLFSLLSFVEESFLSADWDKAGTLPNFDPHVAWNAHAEA